MAALQLALREAQPGTLRSMTNAEDASRAKPSPPDRSSGANNSSARLLVVRRLNALSANGKKRGSRASRWKCRGGISWAWRGCLVVVPRRRRAGQLGAASVCEDSVVGMPGIDKLPIEEALEDSPQVSERRSHSASSGLAAGGGARRDLGSCAKPGALGHCLLLILGSGVVVLLTRGPFSCPRSLSGVVWSSVSSCQLVRKCIHTSSARQEQTGMCWEIRGKTSLAYKAKFSVGLGYPFKIQHLLNKWYRNCRIWFKICDPRTEKKHLPLFFRLWRSIGEEKEEQYRICGSHVWGMTSFGVNLHFFKIASPYFSEFSFNCWQRWNLLPT